MPYDKNPLVWLAILILTLMLFDFSSIDLYIQNLLYNSDSANWIVDKDNALLKLVFYDGVKALLLGSAVALALFISLRWNSHFVRRHRGQLNVVLASLILAPLLVLALKSTTNVACPRALNVFNGDIPYIRLFEAYPGDAIPARRQRCFPAGHASGGFALMSIAVMFRRRKHRLKVFICAASVGWLMGAYKMAIGDHFFSHTLVSMELSGLVISGLNWAFNRKLPRETQAPSSKGNQLV